MIKQHTAKSLSRYLGLPMRYMCPDEIALVYLEGVKMPELVGLVSYNGIRENNKYQRVDRWLNLNMINGSRVESLYPILKTYDKLIEPVWLEGKVMPLYYVFGYKFDLYDIELGSSNIVFKPGYGEPTYTIVRNDFFYICNEFDVRGKFLEIMLPPTSYEIEKLIKLGFGAIANSESPTGYVDLFGYPCVVADSQESIQIDSH